MRRLTAGAKRVWNPPMPMSALKTGDPCPTSGIYRASCGCDFRTRVLRGHLFPECVICGHGVVWYSTDGKPAAEPAPRDLSSDPRAG
jgi:hypothetical protein